MSPQTEHASGLTPTLALTPIAFLVALCSAARRTCSEPTPLRRLYVSHGGYRHIAICPFAFFNLLCPLIAIIYGFTGFALKTVEAEAINAEAA